MKDGDIRLRLKASNFEIDSFDTDTRVVDELEVGYGDARIDLAVINGNLHGFEIKSNHDSLFRFERQLTEYTKAFEYLTFVVGDKHANHILKIIPSWCGLMVASTTNQPEGILKIDTVTSASYNDDLDVFTLTQFLWKDECIKLLSKRGIKKGLSSKNRVYLWKAVAENYNLTELTKEVRDFLKYREDWR